jgi:hypothetical protein
MKTNYAAEITIEYLLELANYKQVGKLEILENEYNGTVTMWMDEDGKQKAVVTDHNVFTQYGNNQKVVAVWSKWTETDFTQFLQNTNRLFG